MPIQIACPDCGKKYRFADERAGETVECKDCGSDIDIPGGRRRGASGSNKRKPQSSGVGAGVMIGGGVGAVVLLGLVAVLMMKDGGHHPHLPRTMLNPWRATRSSPVRATLFPERFRTLQFHPAHHPRIQLNPFPRSRTQRRLPRQFPASRRMRSPLPPARRRHPVSTRAKVPKASNR